MLRKWIILITALIATGYSCNRGSKGDKTLLPNVTGAAGEVVVVLPKALHTDSIGVFYKNSLTSDVPFLPQSEPLFDLIMIPPEAFTDIFKSHRNIIFNEVQKGTGEVKMSLKKDVWAAPQTIVYITGPSNKEIYNYLRRESKTIVTIFEQAERDRVVQNAIKYEEKALKQGLEKSLMVSLTIPKGYRLNFNRDSLVWISFETPQLSQGLILYTFPYTSKNTFTLDYLIEKRDRFVKNIGGPTNGSYMMTSKVIKPELTEMMYKGRYYGVMKGLWDVHNHPMGGPFVSHITIDEDRQRVVVAEAYVYAPASKKRNYLRQVEALLYTLEIVNP